jgi:gamma-glutamylcyclotransferase (GGCT)/AIG2-like uncharacterized protein YtfP
MNTHLFVYGSLLSSVAHTMGERLRREARLVGAATFQGRLYRVSWYPGVVPSSDRADVVHGEVYELDNAATALAWLDRYEGITRDATSVTSADEYERIETPVLLANGRPLVVWIYLYRFDVAALPRVVDGRWRPTP